MPSERRRPQLTLTGEVVDKLQQISKSRSESAGRVERAKMILAYSRGDSISGIARRHSTGRAKIQRCIKKALQFGALTALDDLPRSGRPPKITPEARIWLVNSACQKPKDLGYSFELWTNRLLAEYAHKHCEEAGHPSLKNISRGTVSKILQKSGVRPHKITYYLEYRDPEFESKMAQVLHVYKEVELIKERGEELSFMPILSYDEKPGIQAIANTAPDLPPLPGEHLIALPGIMNTSDAAQLAYWPVLIF